MRIALEFTRSVLRMHTPSFGHTSRCKPSGFSPGLWPDTAMCELRRRNVRCGASGREMWRAMRDGEVSRWCGDMG